MPNSNRSHNAHDEQKKKSELACLQSAREFVRRDCCSEDISAMLTGEIIDRRENEKPDFIIKANVDGKMMLIGVEHFLVDRFSTPRVNRGENNVNRREKVISLGRVIDKEYVDVTEKYNNKSHLARAYALLTKEMAALLSFGTKFTVMQLATSRTELSHSFKIALKHHAEQAQIYRDNMSILANNSCVQRLILLIELRERNNNLTLHCRHGTKRLDFSKNRFISTDIVNVLKQSYGDLSKFDYIVLCIYDDSETKTKNVIALTPNDIEMQLRNNRILVYEYVGDDTYDDKAQEIRLEYGEIDKTRTFEEYMRLIKNVVESVGNQEYKIRQKRVLERCLELDSKQKPYATNIGSEHVLRKHKFRTMINSICDRHNGR